MTPHTVMLFDLDPFYVKPETTYKNQHVHRMELSKKDFMNLDQENILHCLKTRYFDIPDMRYLKEVDPLLPSHFYIANLFIKSIFQMIPSINSAIFSRNVHISTLLPTYDDVNNS